MQEPRRVQMNICPQATQKLGNNTYYYNYDIVEVSVTLEDGEEETQYSYVQVLLNGQPNYKDCVRAVVRSFLTIDEEFDLINSYNSHMLLASDDVTIVEGYQNYLDLLAEIKTKIKKDFGIV